MTLLQLIEPLFQDMCRLNRLGRRTGGKSTGDTELRKKGDTTSFISLSAATVTPTGRGANLDYSVARAEIKALFDDMMAKGASDLRLSQQARKMELPLIFFVDSMISESRLPFAGQWNQNRLAYDRQELA